MTGLKNEVTVHCNFCSGTGEITTTRCGAVPCRQCRGTGQIQNKKLGVVNNSQPKKSISAKKLIIATMGLFSGLTSMYFLSAAYCSVSIILAIVVVISLLPLKGLNQIKIGYSFRQDRPHHLIIHYFLVGFIGGIIIYFPLFAGFMIIGYLTGFLGT